MTALERLLDVKGVLGVAARVHEVEQTLGEDGPFVRRGLDWFDEDGDLHLRVGPRGASRTIVGVRVGEVRVCATFPTRDKAIKGVRRALRAAVRRLAAHDPSS